MLICYPGPQEIIALPIKNGTKVRLLRNVPIFINDEYGKALLIEHPTLYEWREDSILDREIANKYPVFVQMPITIETFTAACFVLKVLKNNNRYTPIHAKCHDSLVKLLPQYVIPIQARTGRTVYLREIDLTPQAHPTVFNRGTILGAPTAGIELTQLFFIAAGLPYDPAAIAAGLGARIPGDGTVVILPDAVHTRASVPGLASDVKARLKAPTWVINGVDILALSGDDRARLLTAEYVVATGYNPLVFWAAAHNVPCVILFNKSETLDRSRHYAVFPNTITYSYIEDLSDNSASNIAEIVNKTIENPEPTIDAEEENGEFSDGETDIGARTSWRDRLFGAQSDS